MKNTVTPISLGNRTNFYLNDGNEHERSILREIGKLRFEAISIGSNSGSQFCIVPLDESSKENADLIILAVNNHDKLLSVAKSYLRTLEFLENSLDADGMSQYNLKLLLIETIKNAEGK